MRYDTDTKELIERWNEINFILIEAEGDEADDLKNELQDIEAQLEYKGVNVEDLTDELLADQESGMFDDVYQGDGRE